MPLGIHVVLQRSKGILRCVKWHVLRHKQLLQSSVLTCWCCVYVHVQSMASKTALVTQMGLELDQVKAAHSQANKAHEGHIGQLIASINEMQELCTKQVRHLLCVTLCWAPPEFSGQSSTRSSSACIHGPVIVQNHEVCASLPAAPACCVSP